MDVLASPEVGHELFGLFHVGHVLKESATRALQVSVSLIAVQVTIPESLELEHLVSQSTALKVNEFMLLKRQADCL
jgi:hypothetical protein